MPLLLGPTGAGKTSFLETIAGLHRPLEGEIQLDELDITRLPPERRNLGIVYQDCALFPHLSVFENIAFGLRLRRLARNEVERRVHDIAELVGIAGLLSRKIGSLSGGERQKVVLCRALVLHPKILLLDEPLAHLDPQPRKELQRLLSHLHQAMKNSALHVTHDFEEAAALGERVAVMNHGRTVQVGTVEEILHQPCSYWLAQFVGMKNVFFGTVSQDGKEFAMDGINLAVVSNLSGPAHIAVRPEDILLSQTPLTSSARNIFQGKITAIEDRGKIMYVRVNVPPEFVCAVTRESFVELGLQVGKEIYISFKASAVHVF